MIQDLTPSILPPKCGPLPEAAYPDLPDAELPERVSVRIDLIIDAEGDPARLTAKAFDHDDPPQAFLDAALDLDHLPVLSRRAKREGLVLNRDRGLT
jgi:hypothetical protein